jgi:DNA-binding beta-propeller fold protein YncE
MNKQRFVIVVGFVAALTACAGASQSPGKRELMVVGNDEKVSISDAGVFVYGAPGKDTVSIIDIGTDPLAPRIIVSLPLMNSIFGPPTNLAITPDQTLALVANSMEWPQEGVGWKPGFDNKIYVIDLTINPPALIDTITVGKQPSGMSINRSGNLALVTNRADNSIAVLRITGKKVTLVDTVTIGEQVTHVVFTPDGKAAIAAKFPGHKLALLEVNGETVTYTKLDVPVGLWPYNFDITPDGKLALSADNGASGRSDGHVDTVTVVDIETKPPRVIDKIVVGDSPEGFAISPTGKLAVAIVINGSDAAKNAPFYNRNGKVVALKIDGKKVTRTNEVTVHGLPEGVVFSDDGKYLYVGNYLDRDVSILLVDGDQLVDPGKTFKLPGQPASMRGRAR